MPDPLALAILDTLTYADIFDYPLTADEIHHYLIGIPATRDQVERALNDPARLDGHVARLDGFLSLPERQDTVSSRLRLRARARKLWVSAHHFTRVLAHLPFVRMVAISGGLAMNNARDNDIDLFIVTAPGRLWLARGFTVALVRLARATGVHLCPNFLITENTLALPDQNLYSAHELAQMVPLYGIKTYTKMRALNEWTRQFLPNEFGMTNHQSEKPLSRAGALLKYFGEKVLGGALGDWLEGWESARKITRLARQNRAGADAVRFSPNVCCGFFSGHSRRILAEFYARTSARDRILVR